MSMYSATGMHYDSRMNSEPPYNSGGFSSPHPTFPAPYEPPAFAPSSSEAAELSIPDYGNADRSPSYPIPMRTYQPRIEAAGPFYPELELNGNADYWHVPVPGPPQQIYLNHDNVEQFAFAGHRPAERSTGAPLHYGYERFDPGHRFSDPATSAGYGNLNGYSQNRAPSAPNIAGHQQDSGDEGCCCPCVVM